jgi:catechol 2,3-dioxygenase-like lactoylglutathione lyase family enzyme
VIEARFNHVNVIARDWRRLADFYTRVFGCEFVPPERDYSGPVFAAGVGVPGGALRGVHLRLPGLGPDGPTIEIYEYASALPAQPTAANRPGWSHIAFDVDDVRAARETFIADGGSAVGEVVEAVLADGRGIVWAYIADPEGNIVELRSWAPTS